MRKVKPVAVLSTAFVVSASARRVLCSRFDGGDDDGRMGRLVVGWTDVPTGEWTPAAGRSAFRTCRGRWKWRSAETALRGA